MSSDEQAAIEAAQTGWLPKRQAELAELCGTEGGFHIDWDSFAGDLKGIRWLEANGPQQVLGALRALARDEAGRAALAGAVQRVVLRNVGDAGERALELADGALELRCAFARSPRGRFSSQEILAALAEHLGKGSSDPAREELFDPAWTLRQNLERVRERGQAVELFLRGNHRVVGLVGDLGEQFVVLTELRGKEFYDALVRLDAVVSCEVRVRAG